MFGFNNKKRILIIGMPDLVLYCIKILKQYGKNIVGVITSPPNNPTYDYMVDFLKQNRLLHIEHNKNFKDKNFLSKIEELEPDIAFVCSFNYKLPKELYEIPKLGTLNFHPSLLPDYRGANPYFHVINNNEKETGVTMHFLDEEFDTGDIVKQVKIPILPNDTMGSLFNRSNELTARMCLETVNQIERGIKLNRYPQDKSSNYKFADKIHNGTDDVKIKWTNSGEKIERFIRALNPFFGAVSSFNGKDIKFWDALIIPDDKTLQINCGTVCEITDKYFLIKAKDCFIKTSILGLDEENYFSDTKEIVEKLNIKQGDILE